MSLSSSWAKVAICGGSSLLAGLLASSLFHPITTDQIRISTGAKVFKEKCAGCHAINTDGQRLGPSLANIGQTAGTRVPGKNSAEYLAESIIEPSRFRLTDGIMPDGLASSLTRYEFLSLLAFLQSKGNAVNYKELLDLDFQSSPGLNRVNASQNTSFDLKAVESGRELFYRKFKCHVCHAVENVPGKALFAPRLKGVGFSSPEHLRTSIENPDAVITEGYRRTRLLLIDGRIIEGRKLKGDAKSLTMLIQAGAGFDTVAIGKEDIEKELASPSSGMPRWSEMSSDELRDLVAFLRTLR